MYEQFDDLKGIQFNYDEKSSTFVFRLSRGRFSTISVFFYTATNMFTNVGLLKMDY